MKYLVQQKYFKFNNQYSMLYKRAMLFKLSNFQLTKDNIYNSSVVKCFHSLKYNKT